LTKVRSGRCSSTADLFAERILEREELHIRRSSCDRWVRNPEELSREFELPAQAIRNGVAQADRDEGRRADGLTRAERQELGRLRWENRQLRIEREILSRARASVARETELIPSKGSFVKANQADYPVAMLCRTTSGSRVAESSAIGASAAMPDGVERIRVLHQRSRRSDGVPRILEDLREAGERINHKRVARLMRSVALVGISRRKGFRRPYRITMRGRPPIE
jgi:transposase-like protein